MKQGKKDLARRLVDEALERIKRHQVLPHQAFTRSWDLQIG